jgi:hypothetical protein
MVFGNRPLFGFSATVTSFGAFLTAFIPDGFYFHRIPEMRKVSRKILIACRVINTGKSALNLLNLVLENHLVSGAFIFDLVDSKVEGVYLLFKKILIDSTHIIASDT